MTEQRSVIVIGAGHNGLVCANYLARAGYKVLVLEAAAQPGGAAVTREFAPGFRASAVAHLLHLLDPVVERELALGRHGLAYASTDLRTVALSTSRTPLVLSRGEVLGGDIAAADRAALRAYATRMQEFARVLARQHGRVPPRLRFDSWLDALPAAALAFDIRRLGRRGMQEFLRVATMNIFDVLEEQFESPQMKGALALDGVLGARLGPRSGNSVYTALYRASGSAKAQSGALALPRGGMGAVTDALAASARAAGVELRLGAKVAEIVVNNGRAVGVRLGDRQQLPADIVVSNADPKSTLLRLLGARHLEAEFARRVHHVRATGTAAKLHLALDGLPRFRGVAAEQLGERLVIAPDLDYIEQAFNPAKYGEYSPQPVMEITLPTVHDASLAPAGQHVLSAIVQYAPYDLKGGWTEGKPRFQAAIMDVLEQHAPGIGALVRQAELLTPLDIEQQFGITGGHWHHGELALDQFMMLRPVAGAAQYATPVDGLYLCGAGCHPGGGVMGSAGRNAARVILGRR
ncbi:MAG: NAD(P)/FAD-dependent oxidoreductase [Proteobacteria bacterium]|nr:NAD(P)/FAD-dependent oxidoreductase [Pseudomonadota bacterium]